MNVTLGFLYWLYLLAWLGLARRRGQRVMATAEYMRAMDAFPQLGKNLATANPPVVPNWGEDDQVLRSAATPIFLEEAEGEVL